MCLSKAVNLDVTMYIRTIVIPYRTVTDVIVIVNRWFEPSQPLGIIPGLKETFMKRYIVERTNRAGIRQEAQSEKTESCRENLWNEI